MKLLVVIVSYRVTDLTIDCLRSLSGEVGRCPGIRVAVCENGTGGDAEERLRRAIDENGWDSWVDLTVIYPNRGFTGGNNAVIRPALESDDPPEYILLLNADTIVQEHALDALVAFMDAHPKAGIAGSMLALAGWDGRVLAVPLPGDRDRAGPGPAAGDRLETAVALGHRCFPSRTGPFRAGWVSGASMILRRTMLEQIGLLDEGLYTYFDDPDICLRACRAGWETWYVPESRVIHLGGASTGVTGNRPPVTASGLLVPGTAPVLPEELRSSATRRWRMRRSSSGFASLAAEASASAQAGHRPAAHADRLDPPQRLLRRLKVPVVENPAMRQAAESAELAGRGPRPHLLDPVAS